MSLRPETLKKYIELARPILIEVARERELITYNELGEKMGGPGRGYIGEILKQVCLKEHRNNRPLLSALVVHKNDRLPGNGFFRLSVMPETIRNGSREKRKFWENERKNIYEHWKK